MCVLVGQVAITMSFEDVWTASAGGEGTFVDGARLINIALRLQRRLRLRCAHYDAAKREREGYYFIDHSIGIWVEEVKLDPIDMH